MPLKSRKTLVNVGTVASGGAFSKAIDLEAADGYVVQCTGTNADALLVQSSADDGTSWIYTGLAVTISGTSGYLAVGFPVPKLIRFQNASANDIDDTAVIICRQVS